MDAEKAGLSREALMGFFIFLLAEKERHQQDIYMIEDKLERLTERYNFTDEEVVSMIRESRRYVTF